MSHLIPMTVELFALKVGDKIRFVEEKQAYTIRARNHRYLVCNKPFNARKTVLYCIVDLRTMRRGPENLVFGAGAETVEQCEEMLERVQSGETAISHRRMALVSVSEVIKS